MSNDTDGEKDSLTAGLEADVHHGTLALRADGSFSYTHDGGAATNDPFTYRASDGKNDSNIATVSIAIGGTNTPPVAVNDSYSVPEGGALNIGAKAGVLANDTDKENDTLTADLVRKPAYGTLTLNGDGSFAYAHDGSETTSDSFTYKANDGVADSYNLGTVAIVVGAVNDTPVVRDDSYTVVEGGTLTVGPTTGVLSNDSDAEGGKLSAVLVGKPGHGILTLNSDGSFTYVHDGSETASDEFTYKANDGQANSNNLATVAIEVTPINDRPIARDDAYGVTEGVDPER